MIETILWAAVIGGLSLGAFYMIAPVLFRKWWRKADVASRELAADYQVSKRMEASIHDLERKFRAEWSDADDYVARAHALWPALRGEILFYCTIISGAVALALAIVGAGAITNYIWWLWALLIGLAVIINVMQWAVAVLGDGGRGEWYEMKGGDRPRWHWPFFAGLVVVSSIFAISGAATIANYMNTSSRIVVSNLGSMSEDITRLEGERDARLARLNQSEGKGYSVGALQAKALETEQAAEREAARVRCGSRCEALKAEAVKWRALAETALSIRKLDEQIAEKRGALTAIGAAGTARDDDAPHATIIERMTAGTVQREQAATFLPIMMGIAAVIIDQVLLLMLGDRVGRYRMAEYRRRAEAANAWLRNAGLPERYTVDHAGEVTDTKLLAAPEGAGGESIHIDLTESAAAKIEKSPRLQQVDNLFNAVFIRSEGHKIPIGRAYELFAKIRSEQGERQYMNPTDFRAAITTYCEILGIELISNQIVGYKIGVASTAKEAAE